MKKIESLIKHVRGVAKIVKKKGKPLVRKILSESIKIERMIEKEAKKILVKKKVKKKKVKKKKVKRRN